MLANQHKLLGGYGGILLSQKIGKNYVAGDAIDAFWGQLREEKMSHFLSVPAEGIGTESWQKLKSVLTALGQCTFNNATCLSLSN